MASLLESAIRKQVASATRGRLLTCTLRRVAAASVDSSGDPVPGAASTWTFDGFRDTFRAEFAAAAGIPVTDARILIIAGSLGTSPQQDDQVRIGKNSGDPWFQLRKKPAQDPANATYEFAGFEIPDPTS